MARVGRGTARSAGARSGGLRLELRPGEDGGSAGSESGGQEVPAGGEPDSPRATGPDRGHLEAQRPEKKFNQRWMTQG